MLNPLPSLPSAVKAAATQAALGATAPSVTAIEPSTPSVAGANWITWALRVGLLVAGGYGIGWAEEFMKWHGEVLPLIAALIATGGVAVWSFVQKQIQAWREHQIALASAAASAAATQRAGEPVAVPVQPPPVKA